MRFGRDTTKEGKSGKNKPRGSQQTVGEEESNSFFNGTFNFWPKPTNNFFQCMNNTFFQLLECYK